MHHGTLSGNAYLAPILTIFFNAFIDNKIKKLFYYNIGFADENNQCSKVLFVTVVTVTSLQILQAVTCCYDSF